MSIVSKSLYRKMQEKGSNPLYSTPETNIMGREIGSISFQGEFLPVSGNRKKQGEPNHLPLFQYIWRRRVNNNGKRESLERFKHTEDIL